MDLPPVNPGMPAIPPNANEKRLKEAVAGFEAIFIQQMLTSMRRTVPQEGLLHGGAGEKMFNEMMDAEYAKRMSQRDNGRGLKEEMFRQLTRNAQTRPPSSR